MTDIEKREQMKELMADSHDADQELAHLQERIKRVSERLQDIQRLLSMALNTPDIGTTVYNSGKEYDLNDNAYKDALNHEKVLELVKDIHKAHLRCRDLNQRKIPFGIK
ncbi:MAG TPA: hypothetical protein VHA33_22705 [Candidatus Angelobacter sp.]|jgi:hypothetical protein|nr:hypothetical protein [Candidatus Angelobacter sp.]